MSRSYKDFSDEAYEKPIKSRKNLRHNGREAFDYFSDNEHEDDSYQNKATEKASIFTYRSVGRGVQGESSN
jgi:hypothetical protein